jgi:glycosyltransferase involved in cell wall biosynthesis
MDGFDRSAKKQYGAAFLKIVIIDPGYAHPHAHHQAVDLAIYRALAKKKVEVVVITAKDMDIRSRQQALLAGMEVLPYFITPCYPNCANALPQRQHEVLSELFANEIIALFESGYLQGDEEILFHTGYSFHITGIARAVWFLRNNIRGRLLISMMFHPGARVLDSDEQRLEMFDHREYLRHKFALNTLHTASARAGIEVMITAPCRAYQRVYQTLWPIGKVQIHPALGYQALLPNNSFVNQSRPRVLLYLGGAKVDKGIEFAARLGAAAALAIPEAVFIFHFNNEFPGANNFASLIDELKQSGETNLNVEVHYGNLDADHYDALLQSSQIVCVLYEPMEYEFKTSGVFWDALRCANISWIVTSNTWPASELKELRIPHVNVDYGNLNQGVEKLAELIQHISQHILSGYEASRVDQDYLQLLNSSFGDWIYKQFVSKTFSLESGSVTKVNLNYQSNLGRILVVRTHYGHFSKLSGPGGFIPHLRGLGYQVDEWLLPLGAEQLKSVNVQLQNKFNELTNGYLRSYQGNSVAIETKIQREMHNYDIVHFVDGEHCGLLSAIYNLKSRLTSKTRLITTYHQPQSILQQIISNPQFLQGFDHIHLMSPCQVSYFEPLVGIERLSVVPHGIAPELFYDKLPLTIIEKNTDEWIPGLDDAVCGRLIVLTVGNWLRDYESLLATAKQMIVNSNIVFVIVSKDLKLDSDKLSNVYILNQGISDVQLHALYAKASMLFLPLQDGAANNAILEAMAHGLPIVSTDLPSTRFYTDELATLTLPTPSAYVKAIEDTLMAQTAPDVRQQTFTGLRNRAQSLTWQKVALKMHIKLYAPLLINTCGVDL